MLLLMCVMDFVMCIDDEGGGVFLRPPVLTAKEAEIIQIFITTLQIIYILIIQQFPALRMEESAIADFRGQKVQMLYPG